MLVGQLRLMPVALREYGQGGGRSNVARNRRLPSAHNGSLFFVGAGISSVAGITC